MKNLHNIDGSYYFPIWVKQFTIAYKDINGGPEVSYIYYPKIDEIKVIDINMRHSREGWEAMGWGHYMPGADLSEFEASRIKISQ